MTQGDFYGSEQSTSVKEDTDVVVEFAPKNGEGKVLKESTPLEKGEVIDASFMSVRQLCNFLEDEIQDAKDAELLFSLHLKATMMKVSDPIMFGSCIRVFFKDAYDKHGKTLEEIGANPNQGLNSIFASVKEKLDTNEAIQILDDFNKCYEDRPWLAMVNSDKGITNLHAPNDSK
jgi:isocitrate dehydrogenase